MTDEQPALAPLLERLAREDQAYDEALSAADRLARFELPLESLTELPEQLRQLNELWAVAQAPAAAGGLGGRIDRRVWRVLAPAIERQQAWNALVVQVVNGYVDATARLDAQLREWIAAQTRYTQRVLPVVDARDRVSSARATTRSELVLEAFDRRQESLTQHVLGFEALRDRLETLSAEVAALRSTLAATAPVPAVAAAAERAAQDASYVAFEARFRGSQDEIAARLTDYVSDFTEAAPVADLGCGRGEFLEALRAAGIEGLGVDGNLGFVQACRAKGLDVLHGDLVAFLRDLQPGELGGVFAAQVAEHLPPPVLIELLREAHRVLRRGGLLVLETVNPRSVVGLLEVFNRDLSHEKPLHPDTLSFLAAAAGFTDVRVELRSPVEADAQLRSMPADSALAPRVQQALDENVARLNALLYGPREYALFARR